MTKHTDTDHNKLSMSKIIYFSMCSLQFFILHWPLFSFIAKTNLVMGRIEFIHTTYH
jgi:hypothetical protein